MEARFTLLTELLSTGATFRLLERPNFLRLMPSVQLKAGGAATMMRQLIPSLHGLYLAEIRRLVQVSCA